MEIINKSIVIGILARDCKDAIVANKSRIRQLCDSFQSAKVIVVENDSTDGTKDVLRDWQNEDKRVTAYMTDYGTVTIPSRSASCKYPSLSVHRIEKMARYREMLLDYIRESGTYDYCIFIDIDIEYFSVEGVVQSIRNAPEDFGGLFANGRLLYEDHHGKEQFMHTQYDTFAYLPYKGNVEKQFGKRYLNQIIMHFIAWHLNNLLMKNKYQKCDSAFGGIGVYKWDAIKDLHYRTYPTMYFAKIGATLCEHVPFNLDIEKKGYSNYISQQMVVKYNRVWNYASRHYRRFPKPYSIWRAFRTYLEVRF